MKTLTIKVLDQKAIQKLEELAKENLIEINQKQSPNAVDWESYVGSLPKTTISEVNKEIEIARNWE